MIVCIGRLRGPNVFGCAGSTTKPAPRLVQHDAALLRADADAEARKERIDQRHRHAVAVDHREVDGVAAGRGRRRQLDAAGRIDPGGELGGECLVDQRRHRHAHESRIGKVRVAHRIGEARGFEREVEAVGAERIERGEVEAFEDVEQHQRGQALAVGRQFEDIETAIVAGDRLDRVAAMGGEVIGGEERAARRDRCRHVVGDRPFVERARPLGGDRLQGLARARATG